MKESPKFSESPDHILEIVLGFYFAQCFALVVLLALFG